MRLAIHVAVLALIPPAAFAQSVLSEVSGTWADGSAYRAVLTDRGETLGLTILDASGAEVLDNPTLLGRGDGAAPGGQRLEADAGGALIVVQEVAVPTVWASKDRIVIAKEDGDLYVVGFYQWISDNGSDEMFYECDVDLTKDESVVLGARHDYPALPKDAERAATWSKDTWVPSGMCPSPF